MGIPGTALLVYSTPILAHTKVWSILFACATMSQHAYNSRTLRTHQPRLHAPHARPSDASHCGCTLKATTTCCWYDRLSKARPNARTTQCYASEPDGCDLPGIYTSIEALPRMCSLYSYATQHNLYYSRAGLDV